MAEMIAPAAVAARPDEDILADVWDALWSDTQIRTLERGNFEIEVSSGVVSFVGHISSSLLAEAAVELAADVPGVLAVENRLIEDQELSVAVGEALAAEPQTHACYLRVDAFHGWINISGTVPAEGVQAAALAAAVAVPGVRGVLGLPGVAGAPAPEVRRAYQPPIGATVNADDGAVGRVRFVMLNPRNRLVTHMGVLGRFDTGDRTVDGVILVPVESVQAISAGSVFLNVTQGEVAAWAAESQDTGVVPAPDWPPPFPYTSEQVRLPAG